MHGLDALTALGNGGPTTITRPGRSPAAAVNAAPVASSPELARIRAIPRRGPVEAMAPDYARMERMVYRPGGTMRLRYEQPQALVEAMLFRGLWAPISVGRGKTLIAALLPTVLDTGPTVILTNAGLVAQSRALMREYAAHFFIRNDIRWLSYSVLSSPREFEILDRFAPKMIISDECQALANNDAARTKRFNRFVKEHPEIEFCAMSGSVTRRSIKDYAKLMQVALKDRTPLPRDWKTLTEWAEALDVSDRPRPGGAIAELIRDEQIAELLGTDRVDAVAKARSYINGLFLRSHNWDSEEAAQVLQLARDAVRRRIVSTPGVVASSENEMEAELHVELVPTPPCPLIAETLKKVMDMWERPDGELLTYGLEIARVTKHVRQGGFYRWVWPASVSREQREDWLLARREFRKELREFLKEKSAPGLDSPYLVEQAIKRGEVRFDNYSAWVEQREEMRAQLADKPEPPTEWVWVSKVVVERVAEIVAASATPLVVWTETTAIGQEIARLCKAPWYGAGKEAATEILKEDGSRAIVASVKAHGTGRNLQMFSEAQVVGCAPSGLTLEQLFGRHHRPGQLSDRVTFRIFDAFKVELKAAIRDARYISATTGNSQKLLTAEMAGLNKERT